jgi:hypothetical protein
MKESYFLIKQQRTCFLGNNFCSEYMLQRSHIALKNFSSLCLLSPFASQLVSYLIGAECGRLSSCTGANLCRWNYSLLLGDLTHTYKYWSHKEVFPQSVNPRTWGLNASRLWSSITNPVLQGLPSEVNNSSVVPEITRFYGIRTLINFMETRPHSSRNFWSRCI